ncbi:DUF1638 domain-containing protein [Candidatus Latescibacterota bacterium]
MLKLISCNVFWREACLAIAESPHVIDAEFTEVGEHIRPDALRDIIQSKIDETESSDRVYDAILLLFGLCGNAGVGLTARSVKLVIPRAHDCCTILLGSRDRFNELFAENPSTPFSSVGYMERGNYFMRTVDGESSIQYGDEYAMLVEQYGEDNAKYVWETMHPVRPDDADNHAVFIDIPETRHLGYAKKFREKAAEEGKDYVRVDGDMHLIRDLLSGTWNDEEYLVVKPGHRTAGVYDWNEVIKTV